MATRCYPTTTHVDWQQQKATAERSAEAYDAGTRRRACARHDATQNARTKRRQPTAQVHFQTLTTTTKGDTTMQANVLSTRSLRFLVGGEIAERFLTMAATPTGAKALIGDGEKFRDSAARGALISAATALHEGVATVERLALDKTRLPPSQHAAAQRVANGVITTLTNAKATA